MVYHIARMIDLGVSLAGAAIAIAVALAFWLAKR